MPIAGRVLWRLGSFTVAWVLAQGIFESLAAPFFGALSRQLGEPVPLYPYSMLVGVLGGSWVGMRFMDPVPWSNLGLGADAWRGRNLALGAALGTAAILTTTFVLWGAQQLHFERVSAMFTMGDSWTGTAVRLAVILAPAALWEELAFRGYLYTVAAEAGGARHGPLLARLTSSVVFGLVHIMNPGASIRTTLIVMLAGWCLCVVRERVGLPGAWTAHVAWNWVMAAVLHMPVSGLPFATPGYRAVVDGPAWLTGGAWGPEGGLVAALVLLGAAARFTTWRVEPVTAASTPSHTSSLVRS